MAALTIQEAIPTAAAMIVTSSDGMGSLAASAMVAAGQLSTSTTLLGLSDGKPSQSLTAEELSIKNNPALELKIAGNEPGAPRAVPSLNSGPGF